jgi:hypothetical protein
MKIVARARTDDPETSHAAAASVKTTQNREAVYEALCKLGQCTDWLLVTVYQQQYEVEGWPKQSASGIRTRRAELVKLGRAKYAGFTIWGETGRRMRVWEPVRATEETKPQTTQSYQLRVRTTCE